MLPRGPGAPLAGQMAMPIDCCYGMLTHAVQALNAVHSDDRFQLWCRLAVQAHAAAFDPGKLQCLCAHPRAVGLAC